MSKSKQQGTTFESAMVEHFRSEHFASARFAEGGSSDIGDLWVDDEFELMWVVEAKATERLNVTRVLGKVD